MDKIIENNEIQVSNIDQIARQIFKIGIYIRIIAFFSININIFIFTLLLLVVNLWLSQKRSYT